MKKKLINLLNLDYLALVDYCNVLHEPSFHAKQLLRWIYQYGVTSFHAMTDLVTSFRHKLIMHANVIAPNIIYEYRSIDQTCKWLFNVGNGNVVETVFIPQKDRGTLCISTQIGCAVNCSFCATGKQGFNRNLSTAEIIGQLLIAESRLRHSYNIPFGRHGKRQISNVVLMGMGEPLLNFNNTATALKLMLDCNAYGLSRRHVTLSTSGIVPMIEKLSKVCPVSLAISLHASNDKLRDILVPINKKYPLLKLIQACQKYLVYAPRNFITFEYCMLENINDSDSNARELVTLLKNSVSCKFNLIPFNSFFKSGLKCSDHKRIQRFSKILIDAGIYTTIRQTRGNDINAACGQLVGSVQSRT